MRDRAVIHASHFGSGSKTSSSPTSGGPPKVAKAGALDLTVIRILGFSGSASEMTALCRPVTASPTFMVPLSAHGGTRTPNMWCLKPQRLPVAPRERCSTCSLEDHGNECSTLCNHRPNLDAPRRLLHARQRRPRDHRHRCIRERLAIPRRTHAQREECMAQRLSSSSLIYSPSPSPGTRPPLLGSSSAMVC
jgi:hypothetical protein